VTSNAGFVHYGANGNPLLRWWPVILFVIVQIAGASVIAYRVEVLSADVKAISVDLKTHAGMPGHPVMVERMAQFQGTLNEVKALVQQHMNQSRR
jgi:hypothetical protein